MATPRESSAAPSSGGDTIDDQQEPGEAHPRLLKLEQEQEQDDQSAADVSASNRTPTPKSLKRPRAESSSNKRSKPKKAAHIWVSEGPQDGTEDEGSVTSISRLKKGEGTPDPKAKTIGTSVGTRRQANGTVGSVYSGSKVRHIKKEDGTPLWRKEIQHEFLRLVVENDQKVFTKLTTKEKDCSFADIYIDCMARSSKTSKTLKDRLQVDRQAANNMAMICLLVNVGRMNTTLNFFPEMRAQLRTYHSIPVLQAYKSQRNYKSLQDAPRLKSILKGASEDEEQPRTIEQLKEASVPRTNPVNLIFVISQFAPKVSEKHFLDKVDFFDLTMRATISSASRARAFLWLMWWYLESSFTKEDALNNPFGSGEYREDQDPNDPKTIPLIVPMLEHITEEEGDAENVDTEEEKMFAEKMTAERLNVLNSTANEPPLIMADPTNIEHKGIKRLKQTAAADDDSIISDVDSRASPGLGRSPAPDPGVVLTMNSSQGVQADSLDDDFEVHDPHPGRGRYKRVRGKNTPSRSKAAPRSSEVGPSSRTKGSRATGTPEFRANSQPLQPGTGHVVISQYGSYKGRNEIEALQTGRGNAAIIQTPVAAHKPRARTHYQRELEEHKAKRIDWALRRRRREMLEHAKDIRERSHLLLRAARRINELPATYDSEDDTENSFGLGGILGKRWTIPDEDDDHTIPPGFEEDDWGEESEMWSRIMERTSRRMEIWSGGNNVTVRNMIVSRPATATSLPGDVTAMSDSMMITPRKPLPLTTNSPKAPVSAARSKKEMDVEITLDLLAERSDEDMADDDESVIVDGEVEVEGEGEGEVDVTEDEDGDTVMD